MVIDFEESFPQLGFKISPRVWSVRAYDLVGLGLVSACMNNCPGASWMQLGASP